MAHIQTKYLEEDGCLVKVIHMDRVERAHQQVGGRILVVDAEVASGRRVTEVTARCRPGHIDRRERHRAARPGKAKKAKTCWNIGRQKSAVCRQFW